VVPAIAVWALLPDKYEGDPKPVGRAGAFTSTPVAVFLAEIGDKTQIATVALAVRFELFYAVDQSTCTSLEIQ
jgi:putative Ca2+/H+ antiporter (TMEM165/GDT1 family)